jgi:hypothetical protein
MSDFARVLLMIKRPRVDSVSMVKYVGLNDRYSGPVWEEVHQLESYVSAAIFGYLSDPIEGNEQHLEILQAVIEKNLQLRKTLQSRLAFWSIAKSITLPGGKECFVSSVSSISQFLT